MNKGKSVLNTEESESVLDATWSKDFDRQFDIVRACLQDLPATCKQISPVLLAALLSARSRDTLIVVASHMEPSRRTLVYPALFGHFGASTHANIEGAPQFPDELAKFELAMQTATGLLSALPELADLVVELMTEYREHSADVLRAIDAAVLHAKAAGAEDTMVSFGLYHVARGLVGDPTVLSCLSAATWQLIADGIAYRRALATPSDLN